MSPGVVCGSDPGSGLTVRSGLTVTHTGRITHSVSLRSDCRKQGLSLDGPRCRDLMLPLSVPPVPISRGRTVIYDIVE